MFVVLGNGNLAKYPQGGGHWSWFLQYPLGLKDLGHRVFWLELLPATGDRQQDQRLVREFFERIGTFGLAEDCVLLLLRDNVQDLDHAEAFGKTVAQIREIARDADLLWNLACALREPLLSMFRRRVLIDCDPGHLQVSALTIDLEIAHHHRFLTAGTKVGDADCEIPSLGIEWRPFLPFVNLPMWNPSPDPGAQAPFTSITQWTWEEVWMEQRVLSCSKRLAYLRYASLPQLARRRFELAANIGTSDPGNDRQLLGSLGWNLVDPHEVAATPAQYAGYIRSSRAEIQCPKPIYRELKTGWFGDRSVCYLASGRPVIAEETGFSERVPTGRGLLSFRNIEEAAAAVLEIDSNYDLHSRAARELAEELFDSRGCLSLMLEACA